MSDEADRKLERDVGALEGAVTALVSQVRENTEKGEVGRARIYEQLENTRIEMTSIKNDLKSQRDAIDQSSETIKKHASTLTEIERWRERFIGMMMLGSAVGGLIITGVIAGFKWLSVKLGFG